MPKSPEPQVITKLSPKGTLQAEIPGPNGSRQVIDLFPGQEGPTLLRLLTGQALNLAEEAWATLQAHRTGKSYEDQLDNLFDLKHKKLIAKRQYQLVESQIGLLPQVKTTKSKSSKAKVQSYHADFSDL